MINYFHQWLNPTEAADLYHSCMDLPMEQRSIRFKDIERALPRLTCWFSDNGVGYTYSHQTTPTTPWTPELLLLRDRLERQTGSNLPSCLLNFYRTGADSVSFHTDDESCFGPNPKIVSLTCGAARKFKMRNRATGEKLAFELGDGDLLVFDGEHARTWEHAVPKTKLEVGQRLNLTFRSMNEV